MKETNETIAEESNEELSTLKESLREALNDGDMQRAGELRDQISPHLEVLKEGLTVSLEKASEILGNDFLGPEEVGNVLRTKIEKEKVPDIPFSIKELEKAKELGQALILRVDKLGDNIENLPLNMLTINGIISSAGKGSLERNCKLNPIRLEDEYNEAFFIDETPRKGWALVGTSCVPGSLDRDILGQTDMVKEYLENEVFPQSSKMPLEYKDAIDSFNNARPFLKDIWYEGNSSSAKRLGAALEKQAITQLTRQTPVEAFYDSAVYYANNGENMFGYNGIITGTKDSRGHFIIVYLQPGGSGTTLVHQNAYFNQDHLGTNFARCS
ncbi:MAG: hypothetical protein Q7S53_05225 [bacterium]|nr:hypothetical protein [bacterium]